MNSDFNLVVFSHLRWKWVYQRPQHLLTRMARGYRVWYIEEPLDTDTDEPWLECEEVASNVSVLRPHMRAQYPFFTGEQLPPLTQITRQWATEQQVERPVVWLYTPMALPVAQLFTPRAVVYDCMDELSAFRFAPPELVQREAQLLQWADVVFTGGPSLYRAKLGRHPNVHCFPSSIDKAHYGSARTAGLQEPVDQAALPRPRLGYFGVVDERLDYGLLDALAKARPHWQIVMVGPLTKVDPKDLPHHANIHFLGQKAYEELPAHISGWDVALMPFARNEATRFISPTKTLEYMAAGRPIVSTPITDVQEPYGDIVYIAGTAEAYIAACDRALQEEPAERARRQQAADAIVDRTSWDDTASRMHTLLVAAAESRSGRNTGVIAP
jgi:UDP-galactopyranose mutase